MHREHVAPSRTSARELINDPSIGSLHLLGAHSAPRYTDAVAVATALDKARREVESNTASVEVDLSRGYMAARGLSQPAAVGIFGIGALLFWGILK